MRSPRPAAGSRTVSELLDAAEGEGAEGVDQVVRSDEPIEALFGNAELRRLGGLAAVDGEGRLIGVITLEQVGRALRRAVGPTGGGSGPDPRSPGNPPQ